MRAQPTISTHAAFHTGAFVPPEGLGSAVACMFDQVIAWSDALRGVHQAKTQAVTAA